MITVYRGSDGDNEPREMQCEVSGYPQRTTCGERMFENTHFLTRAEAWESIRQSAEAGIKLAARPWPASPNSKPNSPNGRTR